MSGSSIYHHSLALPPLPLVSPPHLSLSFSCTHTSGFSIPTPLYLPQQLQLVLERAARGGFVHLVEFRSSPPYLATAPRILVLLEFSLLQSRTFACANNCGSRWWRSGDVG
ncbi:hypothetical protein P691DRAFT_282221 [Macrolepiota fuliginosa MF-IS2]|uniref:Uncharacterized protein n=1 Tax=Macrolepiota fuliginosa MF-IS2 TaxID=1400762 RepID=A0A9P5X630_9AGAR|nr:hypothetical protein P691DRAFT_282221 [Macrolepiota fuliginosa MF-IS2]